MSSLQVGIVGLPNVGKSTLFNALTKQAAESANFPFTTIEPNIGIVPVPDERLDKLTKLSKSAKITPTTIEFVDIAGLVQNAHKGEGLGNKFLSHIREVDAIIHIVRFFVDENVAHVSNKVNPITDVETIETELALADLQSVEQALEKAEYDAKGNNKEAVEQVTVLKKIQEHLAGGKQARDLPLEQEELTHINNLPLLTQKPTLYVANVSEEQIKNVDTTIAELAQQYSPILPISVKIEQEIIELSDQERKEFLQEYGLNETGLNRLVQASYKLLNLITFLTTGPTETRAWTVTKGSTAPQAAGKIHSDMERGFIRAETVSYQDLVSASSYAIARAKGQVHDEGKEYIVQNGDVMLFKFSV
jgi:GTP-binding protein YchF